MSQLRPEESEKTRSREALRTPPSSVARPFARAQAAPGCSATLSCSGSKPCSRDAAQGSGGVETVGKRHELPVNSAFSTRGPTIRGKNRTLFQKSIFTHELNYKFIHKNDNILNSIIKLYNRKRH